MKSICINQKDYEHYLIPLAGEVLFGKNKKQYLFSELEKRHPCFSDDFCFDSKVVLRKRRFFFDVVVINKIKLADYKRKLKIKSYGVHFENLKNRVGFSNRKGIIVTVCLILLFIFFITYYYKSQTKIDNNTNKIDEPVIIVQNGLKVNEFCFQFMKTISDNKGIINNFSWKTDGYIEKISCNLINLYPEYFNDFCNLSNFSDINYVNNIPYMSFSGDVKILNDNSVVQSIEEDYVSQNKIREFLQKNSIKIINEKNKPYSIKFVCSTNKEILEILDFIIAEVKTGISEVNVLYGDENIFYVELGFSPILYEAGLNLSIIKNNLSLFIPIKKSIPIDTPQKTNNEEKLIKQEQNNLADSLLKIGEVIYSDGRIITFYKDKKNNKTVVVKE